jgi:hypothetical protein
VGRLNDIFISHDSQTGFAGFRAKAARRDAKPLIKRKRRTAVASRETAFFVLRLLGSGYCRCNFPVTHLTCFLFFAAFLDPSTIGLRVQTVKPCAPPISTGCISPCLSSRSPAQQRLNAGLKLSELIRMIALPEVLLPGPQALLAFYNIMISATGWSGS